MKKLTKQELVDEIIGLTQDLSVGYFDAHPGAKHMDRALWAALHIGFVRAMGLNGYDESELMDAVKAAQNELPKPDAVA